MTVSSTEAGGRLEDHHAVALLQSQQLVREGEARLGDEAGPSADPAERQRQVAGARFGGGDSVTEHFARLGEGGHRALQGFRFGQAPGVVDAVLGLVEDIGPDGLQVLAHMRDALLETLLGGDGRSEVVGQLALQGGQSRIPEALQCSYDGGVAGGAGGPQLLGADEEQLPDRSADQVLGDGSLRCGQTLPLVANRSAQPSRSGPILWNLHYNH